MAGEMPEVSAEAQRELNRLQDAAAPIRTLQARYHTQTLFTVAGQEFTMETQGRLFIDRGAVCIYRDVLGGLPERQLLYADGVCKRYFPFVQYGHCVVEGGIDKLKTGFGRYWRPFLASLNPGCELSLGASSPDDRLVLGEERGQRFVKLDRDQAREIEARPAKCRLEYWGPTPDITYYISAKTSRIERVVSVHYKGVRNHRSQLREAKTTETNFADYVSIGGVSIPTEIRFEARYPKHQAPAEHTVVRLSEVKANKPLPDDVFEPIWPADFIMLDVENQFPEAYLGTADRPESMIMLGDFHFATDQAEKGKKWLKRFEESTNGHLLTPHEAGHLARLYALAGNKRGGKKIFQNVIKAVEAGQLPTGGGEPEIEMLLTRYYTECAHYLARRYRGKSGQEQAVAFLNSKASGLKSPLAIAHISGRMADFHAEIGAFKKARRTLSNAIKRIGADTVAGRWIEACQRRVDAKEQQNAYGQAIKAKVKQMKRLRKQLAKLEKSGDPGVRADLEELRSELDRLETQP
ncbi:MAG: hypothetical protein KAV82_09885 [Phycisphaerae bacterium]|nr:hypothetical protein [Phycisphaerae bacterium]